MSLARVVVLFLVACAGFVFGFFLTRIGAGDLLTTRKVSSFDEPAMWFVAWNTLIGLSTAYWWAILLTLTETLAETRRTFPLPVRTSHLVLGLGAVFVTIAIVIVLPLATVSVTDAARIPHLRLRSGITTLVAFVAAVPAVIGILWVYLAANEDRLWSDEVSPSMRILNLSRLRERLQYYLFVLGVTVGLAVLAASTLRQVILVIRENEVESGMFGFPPAIVIMYGGLFSAMVLAVYVPAHLALAGRGRWLAETLVPVEPSDDVEKALEQLKRREELRQQLGTDTNVIGDFQTGFALFAPLLATLPSLLLGV